MLSKAELEFLKSPEKFDPDYSRVLRCRIKTKSTHMREALFLLQGTALNITENCNSVTEFSNGQQNQISPNKAAFVEKRWAEPDLNRRPLACKANVLTRLDDRPAQFAYSRLDLSCLD